VIKVNAEVIFVEIKWEKRDQPERGTCINVQGREILICEMGWLCNMLNREVVTWRQEKAEK
jgi:hypothetical protein